MNTPSAAAGIDADVVIVGGGIVGIATAAELIRRRPGIRVLVLEKERRLAAHQTGHNSGVIHAGVYYAPGSLKARFCREGSRATYAFAAEHGIRHERCGKLIVATNEVELERLGALRERCAANGLSPQFLDAGALAEAEPLVRGLAAIRVPDSGIVDYPALTRKLAEVAVAGGAEVMLGQEVTGLRETGTGVVVSTRAGLVATARHAIVCGGLMADRLARLCDLDLDFRIVPFRGEYFRLPSRYDSIRHLIYPVPDPELPFLGIHLTRMVDGSVTVGPNAVLALAREGYRWRDVDLRDLAGMAAFGGFWRTLLKHRASGWGELRNSVWRRGYLEACRKYCPSLRIEDLQPYPAGVRAQAVARDGSLLHDFLIRRSASCLHVCNAPSPAATAAMPIADHLVDRFEELFLGGAVPPETEPDHVDAGSCDARPRTRLPVRDLPRLPELPATHPDAHRRAAAVPSPGRARAPVDA